MFPTFISFTNRHPRFATLIGLTLFILGALLWVLQYKESHTAFMPPIMTETPVISEENTETTYEEKMAILESLKSDSSEDIPFEEKMEVLEELKGDSGDEISAEEKMKILESLK